MAMTNQQRVGKALDLLREGLAGYVEREFRSHFGNAAQKEAERRLNSDRLRGNKPIREWDTAALLRLMWESWQDVFRHTLGHAERSMVSELRTVRDRWAHQEKFTSDDADRALDTAERLLNALSAAAQAEEVRRLKMELRRLVFDQQVREEARKAGGSLIQVAESGALKPWREVVSPHPDVAGGRYRQAEFAADLWQVHCGQAADEYQDAEEFFRRTYLTESLKKLLLNAARRLSGQGGDPVVQLQTNFGGGKTHSMLALYHLFGGTPATQLSGVEALLAEAEIGKLPEVRRVVLVGNKISPGNPGRKPDGTVVRTLWGELAWQLGGREAYELVRADDEKATSPGAVLAELFRKYGPCLVLIDEWVAYARQLHDAQDLPGGTFETQFTFAQTLAESAKAAPACLLVVSLPASDTGAGSPHTVADDAEVGGLRGREALQRLRNVIGRLEASWRPASAEESFEIVRRRLFEPMTDPEAFKARTLTARVFAEYYRKHRAEFPRECAERDYEKRIEAAYPIHPEVFDQLYGCWSTLAKFQRTRGVLRLMAAVIHHLWESGDRNPLILPASIPVDAPAVQNELTRYLSDNWAPIIEKEVDGPDALPRKLDAENANLGKFSACRRVARTIYLGSAPVTSAANQGVEDRRIKLGCAMAGEPPAVFGDALRRLAASGTYLYQDGVRYWYSTQPTVTKLARDRAELYARTPDKVDAEMDRRLRKAMQQRGGFAAVHVCPAGPHEVSDELETRLVVLGPRHPHARGERSPAMEAAREYLESRGAGPRLYRNTLVFLAADQARLQDWDEAVRAWLAWDSIVADADTLDLSASQRKQAVSQRESANTAVETQIPETYCWLLVPRQGNAAGPVEWKAIRLQAGSEPTPVRAFRRLQRDELVIDRLAGTVLRRELDRVPLWEGDHVSVKQLAEYFAQYLYLPRLSGPRVLVEAVVDGVSQLQWRQDTFAYADSRDEEAGRYLGLRAGCQVNLSAESLSGLVVRPEVASRQLDAEQPPPKPPVGPPSDQGDQGGESDGGTPAPPPAPKLPKRFHGTVELDPQRASRDAGRIHEEILSHLVGRTGAKVKVTLEIEAELPQGANETLQRTVNENCNALKFRSYGFESE
ncbi:MAG: ATP-binding protein [Verrucomicrobia bacterium]|nr:MAG: ATP-binding protein [Verrucomicrobiota bacterium]